MMVKSFKGETGVFYVQLDTALEAVPSSTPKPAMADDSTLIPAVVRPFDLLASGGKAIRRPRYGRQGHSRSGWVKY